MLEETEAHFGAQWAQTRVVISSTEAQLGNMLSDTKWQNHDSSWTSSLSWSKRLPPTEPAGGPGAHFNQLNV